MARKNVPIFAVFGFAVWSAVQSTVTGQVGVIDDGLKAAAKAAKVAKAAKAGRLAADMTDGAGRVLSRTAASAATRRSFGLGLAAVSTDAFAATPAAAGRLRVYLGLADDTLTYIPDTTGRKSAIQSHGVNLRNYLEAERSAGQSIEGIDYVAEVDVLERGLGRLEPGDRIFLPNYGTQPWRVLNADKLGYAAEVSPSLWLKISQGTVESFRHLLDLRFDPGDMRVASLFDAHADPESIAAIRKASSNVTYTNIETPDDVLAFVGAKRGRVVTLIGHVEDEAFVVQGLGGEKFRVSIASLLAKAEQRDVSLLLLGCDTAFVPTGAGIAGQVNSMAIASQLERALHATTYSDFLSALGTAANPLVVSDGVLGQVRLIVARRLTREARARRAGITSVQASTRLAQRQSQNATQLIRSLPQWADNVIRFVLGLTFLAFVYSAVASLFQGSLAPMRKTGAVIVGVVLLPVVAVRWLFEGR